ncbi:MAG: hypothetical protein LLG14_10475 [Nocardiaceae bacterium]|nr:hypothetical protein [Nocardiaceae bacterium]
MARLRPRRTRAAVLLLAAAVVSCSTSAGGSPVPGKREPTGGALFAGTQPWTVDVAAAAPSDRSEAIIAALTAAGGWGNDNAFQIDFSIPVFYADSSTPRMTVVGTDPYCFGGPDCDKVPAEMPVPEGAHMEGSEDLSCDSSENDCHLLVVDAADEKLYEIYHGTRDGDSLKAEGFFVWDLNKTYPDTLRGEQCTSADAAGFPIAGLLPTADEVAAGEIPHALRFILPNDRMKEGVFVRPATHAGGPASSDPNAPPYGVRFRLRADFDDSGFNASEKVVIAALKTYGMLLSDGGQIPLTFADDSNSTAKWADLGVDAHSFAALSADQFEVVELGDEIPLTYDCVRN